MTDFIVDGGGGQDFTTITAAIASGLEPGDNVYVNGNQTYSERVVISGLKGLAGKAINFIGVPVDGRIPKVDPTGEANEDNCFQIQNGCEWLNFARFEMLNSVTTAFSVNFSLVAGDTLCQHIGVFNNYIHDAGTAGSAHQGVFLGCDHGRVAGNVIDTVGQHCVYQSGNSNVVQGNVLLNADDTGVRLVGSDHWVLDNYIYGCRNGVSIFVDNVSGIGRTGYHIHRNKIKGLTHATETPNAFQCTTGGGSGLTPKDVYFTHNVIDPYQVNGTNGLGRNYFVRNEIEGDFVIEPNVLLGKGSTDDRILVPSTPPIFVPEQYGKILLQTGGDQFGLPQ